MISLQIVMNPFKVETFCIKDILDKGKEFSVPSVRIEHITPKIIQIFERGGVESITIAPETGTESLRFSLGKKISNEKILEVLDMIKNSKIKNAKFYFLVGLPNETDRDIEEIIDLFEQIDEMGFTKNQLRAKINPFVPKLNTPYENQCMFYLSENLNALKMKFTTLKRGLQKLSSVKIKFQDPKRIVNNSRLQTLFSLGNRSTATFLLAYYHNGANMGAMRRTEKELNFSVDKYFKRIQAGFKPWKI